MNISPLNFIKGKLSMISNCTLDATSNVPNMTADMTDYVSVTAGLIWRDKMIIAIQLTELIDCCSRCNYQL